ncbi:hypothetical protein U9M48_012859 [Paspalum notatum var. saurae]|uniref:RING-type E3 ubiquitin transferase n=1 Tax=Paspalum notatum var. saurae TaxID=547442 RepID=A0AAQ3SYF4_PASNO
MATTAGSSSPHRPHADDSPEQSLPGEKVYVAVGREEAESRATLLWALQKFCRGAGAGAASLVLLHVYSPPKFLPLLGARIPAAQVEEQELAAYREMELQTISDTLDQYLLLCAQEKVHAEKLVVESDNVAQGLVDVISEYHITALVMGAASDKHYTKKMKILKSRKARFIEHQADPLCKIWFICKGTLVYCRKAVQLSHEEMQEGKQSSGITHYSVEKSASLSEMWCIANTWLCKSIREPHIQRTTSDPSYISGKDNTKESYDCCDNFQHVLRELESVRQEAYEEKCRREKLERELCEAFQKAQASEILYFQEMKQKNELEEKLTTIMEEIESLTIRTDELCAKLQGEREQRIVPILIVEILSRVRHPNLVTLIGACKDAQALVYEYMPNGSLDDRLACKDNSKPLCWQLRTRIASNICSALIFLHSNKPHSIVHSDLKASNILLDGNNIAKLSGFGVCQILTDQFKARTTLYRYTHPKGSFVYIDPQYLVSGDLTPLSDVYSFGIILLRLLTGRSGFGLLKEVQQAVEKGCLQAILDSSAGEWPAVYAEQLAQVGLKCCDIRRKNRPDLQTEVWTVLEPMLKSASAMLCSLSFKSVSEDLGGVPSYFICPILQDVMRDPLIAADGFTYEAEAIREWLDSSHRTSPMTNLELPHRDLLPNHALRSAIQEWLQTNGD